MSNTEPLIRFSDVSFTWPDPDTGQIEPSADGTPARPLFDAFSADIPSGFISLVGPNGSGKSSFMLLASGRIMPTRGRIELSGYNTRILSGVWANESGSAGPGLTPEIEHKRNLVCSFLYQNMEFEEQSDDSPAVGQLLEYVYANGGYASAKGSFYCDVLSVFELGKLLARKLDALSKGELQRVLLAFSALYGSKVIMMDEPLFAMEQYQKEKTLEFFGDIYRSTGVSVLVSLHELALTRKYADTVMLFYPDRRIDLGTRNEVLTNEALESAYGVPAAMLHDTELLTRRAMIESASLRNGL
jgi:iron complex transport system ATP-binding protein